MLFSKMDQLNDTNKRRNGRKNLKGACDKGKGHGKRGRDA